MKKRIMEILEVKHLISLLVTIVILGLIIYLIVVNTNVDLSKDAFTTINNAFSIILGYLFGRQKHLDVNQDKEV